MSSNQTTVYCVVVVVAVTALVLGAMFGVPAYQRSQALLNAQNKVHVTEIEIQNTEQLVDVEKRKARIRVEEAKGIAESQRIINATLTDKYLQHEAIKAQERMAGSPSHTQIYIPSGQGGIPLIKTVDAPPVVEKKN